MKPRLVLPRVYLRMSPNLDQHPDPEGMVLLLCAANRQPTRGRFRDKRTLSRALGAGRLKRFLARGDIVMLADGWYVDGWDEWQEGDLTVGERQARIRDRRRDSAVTQPLSDRAAPSDAIDVPTHVGRRISHEIDEGSTRSSAGRGARADRPVDPGPADPDPTAWLTEA